MGEFNPRSDLQEFPREVSGAARSRARHGKGRGIGSRFGDQFGQRAARVGFVVGWCHQDVRAFGQQGDGGEVFKEAVGQFFLRSLRDGDVGRGDEQGVAVAFGFRHKIRANIAIGPGSVVHQHGLAKSS